MPPAFRRVGGYNGDFIEVRVPTDRFEAANEFRAQVVAEQDDRLREHIAGQLGALDAARRGLPPSVFDAALYRSGPGVLKAMTVTAEERLRADYFAGRMDAEDFERRVGVMVDPRDPFGPLLDFARDDPSLFGGPPAGELPASCAEGPCGG